MKYRSIGTPRSDERKQVRQIMGACKQLLRRLDLLGEKDQLIPIYRHAGVSQRRWCISENQDVESFAEYFREIEQGLNGVNSNDLSEADG
jgi:hypothetical protein